MSYTEFCDKWERRPSPPPCSVGAPNFTVPDMQSTAQGRGVPGHHVTERPYVTPRAEV